MIGLGTATAQLNSSVNIAFPAITRGFRSRYPGYSVGGDLLRPDLRQPAAGDGTHRRHRRSRHCLPDRPDLERGGFPACRLCAELWRDAVLPLPARRGRGARPELRRRAGDVALWRSATRPGARHLHHDDGAWSDGRPFARRRLDGGVGLACGVLVPDTDCDCGAAAVARHAGAATAPGRRPFRFCGRHRADRGPRHDAAGAQSNTRVLGDPARAVFVHGLCRLRLPAIPRRTPDHRDRSSQVAGLCTAEPHQRDRPISRHFRSGCWCRII